MIRSRLPYCTMNPIGRWGFTPFISSKLCQKESHREAVRYLFRPSPKPTNLSPDRGVVEEATFRADVCGIGDRRGCWRWQFAASFDRRQGRHLVGQARQEESVPTAIAIFGPYGTRLDARGPGWWWETRRWRSTEINWFCVSKPQSRHACAKFVRAWTHTYPSTKFRGPNWDFD
jgi:hypothetical protein